MTTSSFSMGKSFVYLGSLINTEVSCMPEVDRRLCMARSTIENMTTIWKSQAICKSLKLRVARATAFAVATYGCESWAYAKKVTKKIEAFEMWTYRRLLRVSSRQYKTNAWILEQLSPKPMLVKQMRKRKMKHFGHIIRHNSLEKTKDHHPRDHCREERQRETSKNLGERHRGMGEDKHWWSNQNGRGGKPRDLWCTVIDVTAAQPWAIWTEREDSNSCLNSQSSRFLQLVALKVLPNYNAWKILQLTNLYVKPHVCRLT